MARRHGILLDLGTPRDKSPASTGNRFAQQEAKTARLKEEGFYFFNVQSCANILTKAIIKG